MRLVSGLLIDREKRPVCCRCFDMSWVARQLRSGERVSETGWEMRARAKG